VGSCDRAAARATDSRRRCSSGRSGADAIRDRRRRLDRPASSSGNLRALGHDVLVFDADPRRAEEAAAASGADVLPSLDAGGEAKLDGVLVCTPPSRTCRWRVSRCPGAHLFIEKPVAPDSAGVSDFLAAPPRGQPGARGRQPPFFRPLQRVKALVDEDASDAAVVRAQCGFYLPSWKPGADYRQLYRSQAAEGGGILLDVIHEFRLPALDLRRGAGSLLHGRPALDARIDVEDFAEVTLRFRSGVLAQLHLDYCSARIAVTARSSASAVSSSGPMSSRA